MKPVDILAIIPIKLEDMPEIETNKIKPTHASIKYFKEIIQVQSMSITTCDNSLGLLLMVLQASDFNPLNNCNPSVRSEDPGPAPNNAIGTAAQITGVVLIYKDNKYKLTFTRIQMHRNQSMIKAYLTTSLHIQDIIVSP